MAMSRRWQSAMEFCPIAYLTLRAGTFACPLFTHDVAVAVLSFHFGNMAIMMRGTLVVVAIVA